MRSYWLAGLGFLVCGCGLADYEQQMVSVQARQQHIEEEARLLDGSPLRMPVREDKNGTKAAVADLFLRPPAGIGNVPTNEADPRGGLLYSYLPRQGKMVSAFARVEFAVGDLKNKDFAGDVLKTFTATSKPTSRQHKLHAPGRLPHSFETFEFQDEQFFYSVNVMRGSYRQVAIVFWVTPPDKKEASKRAIQVSLESLAVDNEKLNKVGPLDVVPGPPPS
jgi:hypothetical protein